MDHDPATGRWTRKDTERFRGRSTNLYSYVSNDPINAIDPDGRIAFIGLLLVAAGEAFVDAVIGDSAIAGTLIVAEKIADDASQESNLDRTIWLPDKRSGGLWVCKGRADCDDNMAGNCPAEPKHRFAFGGGVDPSLGRARNIAKANATSNLQCKPKHVSCKCIYTTGEVYIGGC
jgi:hypothetical protein